MILQQESEQAPKEAYICFNNDCAYIRPKEKTNQQLAVGTPLLFIGQTDSGEYLLKDAHSRFWQIKNEHLDRCVQKLPNRLPNFSEKLLYPILSYDRWGAPGLRTEFIVPPVPVASIISALFCPIFGWIFQSVIVGVVFALLPYMFSLVLFLLKKRKVFDKFLYLLQSPYREQLLAELKSLLEHNEAKEHNND